jgi:hypothetical protein
MKRFGIFQISSVRHFSPLKNWIGIFFVFLMIGAQFSCAALRDTASEESDATAVFAGVIVHSVGPYPRIYPLKVRFFDFVNKTSRERIRVNVQNADGVFFATLLPGDYQLIRMQMMEGPFRREAHMAIDFHVPPKKKVYLGEWTFEIDTPRTVRMARIHISDQYPQSLPSNETEGIGSGEFHTVLPEPQYEEFRLFVVAPSPRARYFTR